MFNVYSAALHRSNQTTPWLVPIALALALAACNNDAPTPTDNNDSKPPTVSISATPDKVTSGTPVQLNWSATNASSCTASSAWEGNKATTGTETIASVTANGTYTLTCTGNGGSRSDSATVIVTATSTPTVSIVTFKVAPANVLYNASATFEWSSVNASTCTASGAWSGIKTTSGTQTLAALTTSGTYTLTCTNLSGGSDTKSLTVTVQPAPLPTMTLTASPTRVTYNGKTTLRWSSNNATLCEASGPNWNGPKALAGEELRTSLTSGSYKLTCTGPGGSVNVSVDITVVPGAAGTVTGSVDSSRINRNGVNKVYLFSGAVTPDDYDGDSGDPVANAVVTQDENACTFSYTFADAVPAGTYTIALTNQAANDVAGQDNALTFVGSTGITVGASAVAQNFAAARVLTVGPGKTYAKPSLAGAAAQDGDVVEIDAVEYLDDPMVWRDNNLTLRGVGGRPHMKGTQIIPWVDGGTDAENGQGLWVLRANNIVVENVEFSGAVVADENGSGIWASGSGLVVCNSYFHDNENGILGGAGEVLIEYSEFNHNGHTGAGEKGKTHNLYIDYAATKFVFRHNYSHHAFEGHELKSNAVENHILYNRLSDEDGNASYTINIPHGGLTYIISNIIQQGTNSPNSGIVSYGEEGVKAGRTDNLYLVSNTLVNNKGSGTFVFAAGSTKVVQLINNLFVGNGTEVNGPAAVTTKITNLNTADPNFVNQAAYDYRLTASTPAAVINQGSDPGTINGFDTRPVYQYVHPAKRELRPSSGAYDIGAYEYVP